LKLNCLIVDDEPLAIDVLKNYVERLDYLHLSGTCRNATEAVNMVKKEAVDLIFLDIRMPDMNGVELAKTLGKTPLVIFTTASREFAVQSYETCAVDYLVKPVHFDKFLKAVEKAASRQQELEIISSAKTSKTLLVKADNKTFRLNPDDILFVESIRDHVVFHLAHSGPIVSYTALTAVEQELSRAMFIRTHRSYLVALHAITAFSNSAVEIGDISLPIGRTYRDDVIWRLQEHQIHL